MMWFMICKTSNFTQGGINGKELRDQPLVKFEKGPSPISHLQYLWLGTESASQRLLSPVVLGWLLCAQHSLCPPLLALFTPPHSREGAASVALL